MYSKTAIIVDDHTIFRESLAYLLTNQLNINVLAQANNGEELMRFLEHVKPDIILMDIEMPVMDGIEATRLAIKKFSDIKILVLSMHDDEEFYNSLMELGVKGFILKESCSTELKRAIEDIIEGKLYFSQELLFGLLKRRDIQTKINLSPRELEVLTLIAKGFSNSEIADKLFISVRTVEKHRAELLLKTESRNSISLVVYAIKNGLVTI